MERELAAEKEAAQVGVEGLGIASHALGDCFPVGQATRMALPVFCGNITQETQDIGITGAEMVARRRSTQPEPPMRSRRWPSFRAARKKCRRR